MDIYLFCIVQKEFIFIKIAEGIVIEMEVHGCWFFLKLPNNKLICQNE